MDQWRWGLTIDLLSLIDAAFRQARGTSSDRLVQGGDLAQLRGGPGILRKHVEESLRSLEIERAGSEEVGRALLEAVVERTRLLDSPGLDAIAGRLGVSTASVLWVLQRLSGPTGLIRSPEDGVFDVSLPHLSAVIRADVADRTPYCDLLSRIVDEGVRAWSQLGEPTRKMLNQNGWTLANSIEISRDFEKYRRYIQTARREVSRDGKTITLTFKGTSGSGQPVHNVMVFDRR